ncbi:hypothetical protein GN956_G15530 [Arapaima gigas]
MSELVRQGTSRPKLRGASQVLIGSVCSLQWSLLTGHRAAVWSHKLPSHPLTWLFPLSVQGTRRDPGAHFLV